MMRSTSLIPRSMLRSRARGRATPPKHGQRGFSFIEILIVMGIISVLVGGIVVAIGIWTRKGPVFATQNTMNKTKLMIENWKQRFEMYPPSDMTRIATVAGTGNKAVLSDNPYNGPIEAIYQALYWPGFSSDPEWGDAEIGNTDDDKLGKPINKHGTPELMEVVDAWGHPFVYFHRDDYAKKFDAPDTYLNGEGLDVEARPHKREDGSFYNPSSFQIYSMGEDGEPNTEDDITPWSK